MTVQISKRIFNALKRLFPLHPLHIAVFAFVLIVYDRVALDYYPSFSAGWPIWLLDVFSIFLIVGPITYAGFAAFKAAENLYGISSPARDRPAL